MSLITLIHTHMFVYNMNDTDDVLCRNYIKLCLHSDYGLPMYLIFCCINKSYSKNVYTVG